MPDVMENDPLNDIINEFSKVEEWETAAYQVICHPISKNKWQKTALQKSKNYFSKKQGRRKIFS